MKRIITLLLLFVMAWGARAQETYQFASRDTCDLYLDIFRPELGSSTTFQGQEKPTILHVFGGGFVMGKRSDGFVRNWVKLLNEEGYTVVTMDYRLGMKGYKMGKGLSGAYKSSDRFLLAQTVGVEDVFAAVSYLIDNRDSLSIDTDNLVLSGSSAGAIITLAAVRDLANGHTGVLPQDFRFKGAMSFAGAIISTSGAPQFESAPCPVLLMHGTEDQAVTYKKFGTAGRGIWGSDYLADQWSKKGWTYCIYRFKGRTHDVAGYHLIQWPVEKQFLEQNVILGHKRTVDATVQDDSLPSNWGQVTLDTIYR